MHERPYGLMSDQHAHAWSSFSTLDEEGRNTRLMGIIAEIHRCCDMTRKAGGDTVVLGGDLFHTRGSVEPEVFNPVRDAFLEETRKCISFIGIAGNHDLGSRESLSLHSSVQMLHDTTSAIGIAHKSTITRQFCLVPWHSSPSAYLDAIGAAAFNVKDLSNTDLICHIGIDGTLSGMPDHGVTAEKLASFGFRRVFSGHYHNFKDFGDGVYSIGALTHQTWGDVGTQAGFLIVHPDRVERFASHQPMFVDLHADMDEADIFAAADGNYVRFKIGEATNKEVSEARELLAKMGAKGVSIVSVPKTATEKRSGVSAKSISSLGDAVVEFCKEKGMNPDVMNLCSNILSEVSAS